MRVWSRIFWAGLFALWLPTTVGAQDGQPSVPAGEGVLVRGQVVDQVSGEDLPSALVTVTRLGAEDRVVWDGLTSSSGAFVTEWLPMGAYEVRVELLSFNTIDHQLLLDERGQVELRMELVPAALELDPVVVTAIRRNRLQRAGFYERRDMGLGYQLNRGEIEARGASRVSDIFYSVPGARVVTGAFGRDAQVRLRGDCVPLVVLDGQPISTAIRLDALLSVHDLEAIEVYHGSSAPVQYSNFTTCGTIMAWTREPDPREGQPFSWRRLLAATGLVVLATFLTR